MVNVTPVRHIQAPQYNGLRLSADEYLALPDDGFRYQVIDGVVVWSPSPDLLHQFLVTELCGQLYVFLRASRMALVCPATDVRLAADLMYRPDLVVLRSDRIPKPFERIDIVPDFIIEVDSPDSESMDLRTKLADYERYGVPEYWVVSPSPEVSVRVWRMTNGRYAEQPVSATTPITSATLPGFTLDLAAVRSAAQD